MNITMEQAVAFINTVYQLRDVQQKFFKTRQSHHLKQARKLEAEVDALLRQFLPNKYNGGSPPPTLF